MARETEWMSCTGSAEPAPSVDLRTEIAHTARIYDALLGGKDNFPADRAAAEQILRAAPEVRAGARLNRAFLGRAVRHAATSGIGQFLDIGTGIPTAGNTHEVAQQVNAQARVAYVDNDPIVLSHARALMAGAGHGATRVIQADLRDPQKILADPAVTDLLDFEKPVALVLAAILHFIDDADDPHDIVELLVERLAPGSMLILSHASGDTDDPADAEVADRISSPYSTANAQLHLRSRAEITRFFTGTNLLDPGLVPLANWRAQATHEEWFATRGFYCGVSAKP
ncbi:SAM-dependent methyltransferase [Streptacidiphilus sp. EB103A]|uniref:SAM-dependent methyltransferase n=1 Tax=Streptacidiphilus sp. EB103A TaxID=3156275 RepID=UPI003514709D